MTATEIQMRVARADEAREQKQREFLQPLVDAHLAVLDARAPRLIANSVEADRVNLLWEKGLLWEDDSGKLSADPPTPKPGKFREFLQRKADEALMIRLADNQNVHFGKPDETDYGACLLFSGAEDHGCFKSPVTEEMIKAAIQACDAAPSIHWNDMAPAIYRAMAAVAPVELVSAAEDRVVTLEAQRDVLIWARDQWRLLAECRDARIAELESQVRMLMSDKANHDYIGPAKDGKAVADEVHERFHKALGDVATGGVMRPARDQMEKALADAKAKDGKAPQPIRGITRSGDPRIGGWMA